eukprot:COSAG01_NODE_1661_length_9583_cov_37.367356_3_plen_80_part_00
MQRWIWTPASSRAGVGSKAAAAAAAPVQVYEVTLRPAARGSVAALEWLVEMYRTGEDGGYLLRGRLVRVHARPFLSRPW